MRSISFADETTEGVKVINGHTFVDLGLPSKTLWATCNIGAKDETYIGDYFSWGETELKSNFDEDSMWSSSTYVGNLKPEDDVATTLWGEEVQMPTWYDIRELFNNCKFSWQENYKGSCMKGFLVTGKNGNSIFFSTTGYGIYNHGFNYEYYGGYWTSTPYEGGYSRNLFFNFVDGDTIAENREPLAWLSSAYRSYGLAVRPVAKVSDPTLSADNDGFIGGWWDTTYGDRMDESGWTQVIAFYEDGQCYWGEYDPQNVRDDFGWGIYTRNGDILTTKLRMSNPQGDTYEETNTYRIKSYRKYTTLVLEDTDPEAEGETSEYTFYSRIRE